MGAPIYFSHSFSGRPHDMLVCKFPELRGIFNYLDRETRVTGEFGMGDNAFSAVKNDLVKNFIYSPRVNNHGDYELANYMARIRHAVENVNASLETFNSLRNTLRLSPTYSMEALLEEHHKMVIIVGFIVRETHHKHPLNKLSPPPSQN